MCDGCHCDKKSRSNIVPFPVKPDEASSQDISFVCEALRKMLNYHNRGCACADTCEEINGDCADNPQCTGEFVFYLAEDCQEPLARLQTLVSRPDLAKAS